jgi:putative transposase
VAAGKAPEDRLALVHYPPKVAIAKLVNSLNGSVSSRWLRQMCPEVRGRHRNGILWSPSFAASCGGAPLSVIAEYGKL